MKAIIYGAYGYTGQLIVELAVSKGLRPTLAGRDHEKLRQLAEKYGLDGVAFSLDDNSKLDEALGKVDLAIHIAGPYAHTAKLMVDACIRTNTDYIDVTGEIEVFEWMAKQHGRAMKAGIVLMPGTGFDVVPTDCLAAYLKSQLPDATKLVLAFKGTGKLSRGTALTMAENLDKGGAIRKDGKIVPVRPAYEVRTFPFDGNPLPAATIPWGDVATAFHTTGIPDIRTYMSVQPAMLKQMKLLRYFGWVLGIPLLKNVILDKVRKKVTGPSADARASSASIIYGEVQNEKGETKKAGLKTLEAYTLTAITCLMCAERVLKKTVPKGFQTPAGAFGPEFILEVGSTKRWDILD